MRDAYKRFQKYRAELANRLPGGFYSPTRNQGWNDLTNSLEWLVKPETLAKIEELLGRFHYVSFGSCVVNEATATRVDRD